MNGPAARLLQLVDDADIRGVTMGEARTALGDVRSWEFDDTLSRMLAAQRGWLCPDTHRLYSTAAF